MLADRHLAFRRERPGVEHEDLGRAPDRDVQHLPVRREDRRVGLSLEICRRDDLPLLDVDRADFLAVDLRRVDALAIGAHRHTGDVTGVLDDVAPGMPLGSADRNGAGRRNLAVHERVFVEHVLARARREQPLTVRLPDEAEPRVLDVRASDDLQRVRVEDAERGLRPPTRRDRDEAPVGRRDQIHRQIADRDMASGGRQLPAVGQQRHAVALIPWPDRPLPLVGHERRERGRAHDARKSDQQSRSSHARSSSA